MARFSGLSGGGRITRRQFMSAAVITAAAAALRPGRLLAGCDLTSPDVLGPFHAGNAPFRTVLCSKDEPGTRLFISGRVFANDCTSPIPGAIVDVWHARADGCYSVFQNCPDEDPFNCRGQMLTNGAGQYAYETILPGYYTGRPLHVHYLVAPPEGPELVTQLYFELDPQSEGVPPDLRIPLEEIDSALYGTFDITLNATSNTGADGGHSIPTAVALHQNYPNPFNPATTIRYQLRLEAGVVLEIVTPDGRVVRRLVNAKQGPGYHTVAWDGRDDAGRQAASGIYLYRLDAGSFSQVRKMMLVR